jgi:hydroxymethylpyrimidine pyrophosphatase-like HAD family hydrolase
LYFLALAVDYDGTIAHDGKVDEATYNALKRFKESGRRLLLVTGRELEDLIEAFPGYELFDRVVAENGALIYDPASKQARLIGEAPPPAFLWALRERGVKPLSAGERIIATTKPWENVVLDVIRDLGLELQIIFNKGAVMILPSGINKAEGFNVALTELGLSPRNAVAAGDAENDLAFLTASGCSAAVANALPSLKQAVDLVLEGECGAGIAELISYIIDDDARIVPASRRGIRLGDDGYGNEVYLDPAEGCVLISGSSGIGKSRLATALTERMAEERFQFCIFDPEGDYAELEHAISIGGAKLPPDRQKFLKLLSQPDTNVVVNTLALEVDERRSFFASLFPQISAMRTQTGRPHWLLIDEANHLLAAPQGSVGQILPRDLSAAILITVHPEALAIEILRLVETVVVLGPSSDKVIAGFCEQIGVPFPAGIPKPAEDEILVYSVDNGVEAVKPHRPSQRYP